MTASDFERNTVSSNNSKTGAQIIVESLERHGVTHVFGVPGAKIDKVFDTLKCSAIETVVCRHEQNAAFIAGGIGRLTGRAGVAVATSGPGVSNLTTGLATSNSEGDPMVALGGSVATSQSLKRIHQTLQAISLLKPVTKFCAEVGSPKSNRRGHCECFPGSGVRSTRGGICKFTQRHYGGRGKMRSPRCSRESGLRARQP